MIKVQRKDGESSEKLLKRWSGHIKSNKLIQKFRNIRYYEAKPVRTKVRAAAIKREKYRAANQKKRFMNH